MKICPQCGKTFPSSAKIDGKRKTFQRRKFCFECSPYKCHNTTDFTKIAKIRMETRIEKRCTKCNCIKPLDEFYIKNKEIGKRYACCRKCMSEYMTQKTQKTKLRALEYKGGKCIICGYDKCVKSLCFHHLNPEEKDFAISQDTSRNWQTIKQELDKCVLLCQNCHNEIHAGITQLP